MKKFYYLIVALLFFNFSFSQNTEIKTVGGGILPTPYNYCASTVLNLEVDDYLSNATSTTSTVPINVFNSILSSATGETDVLFNAAVTTTDKFSYPIDLEFNFKFFNKTYTRVVVGSNGRLVFTNDSKLDDLNNTTNFIDQTLLSPAEQLPSPKYNMVYKSGDLSREIKMAQIFAAFTRLKVNFSTGGYKYKKFNDAVNGKGILITFQSVIPTNGVGGDLGPFYTSRVILFEDGRIVLNVQDKTAGSYNAILGMQNEDGDKEIIPGPVTNNNGNWSSVSGDAYVVTTGSTRTPSYLWELDRNNDGTIDETSATRFFPNYSPTSDVEKLSVKITFAETSEIKTSEVIFNKIKTPVIEGTLGCVYDMKVNDATYDSTLLYTWYRVGQSSAVGSGRNLSLDREGSIIGDYYVKISNSDGSILCPGSNESNRLTFNTQRFPGLVKNSFCLTDNTLNPPATKTISLYDEFYPKYDPASGLEPYQIIFYTNAGAVSDADAANFVVPANTELNLQFGVKEITGTNTCHSGGLTLYYLSMPPTKTISLCSSVTTYNLKSVFQNPSYPAYAYYYTYIDDGSIADGNAVDVTRTVNVKTSAATCFTNTVVNFVLGATVTLPDVPIQERCKGADNNANRFDFNYIKTLLDPTNQYDIKFYNESNNTEIVAVSPTPTSGANLNPAGYFWSDRSGDYIIYAKVIDRADPTCFSISNNIVLRVYAKPQIQVANPISLKNCVGNSIFNLSQNPSALTNAGPEVTVKLEYYSAANVLLSNSDITQYDAGGTVGNPYIKIIYNVSCSDIINFDLGYHPKPAAIVSQIVICAETTYLLQDFKNEVINNSSNYTFTDSSGAPLPLNFNLSILPHVVKFFMKDNTTGCISDEQTVTFVKGVDSALLTLQTDFTDCDLDFDGKLEFDLDTKKAIFTNGGLGTFEYFKDDQFTQPITAKFTNDRPFAQTIYVRITILGFCPTKAEINLIVNTPIISTTLEKEYFICYRNPVNLTSPYVPVKINAGTENDIFLWSDGQTGQEATFNQPGNYSVTLKKGTNGCPYTHNFVISDENQPKITTITQTNNSIEVTAEGGVQPYTYYFNGVPQSVKTLLNPTESAYEIQVESATGCFGPPKSVYFIKINNAFTPNGDGKNDFWKIDNLDKMEKISIVIVDRNGTKVFESNTPSKNEWDGKHNGRGLPSSTYWYVISWYDSVTQKTEQRQGWILLKNRD